MGTDLLARTAQLVDIASVSHDEAAIATHVEAELRSVPWLDVERVGDNVVARTRLRRDQRLILAGHLDTVPPNGNEQARLDGDVLWGIGSADMKGGLAVFMELARTVAEPAVDLTYVFYVCEEVSQRDNGLVHMLRDRPDLLAGDAAILGEPTGAQVEAGCQGAMRVDVTVVGERAHSARPWTGINAIHRIAPLLDAIARYEARTPVIDGCEFREALQVVKVDGFVAYNVVPDRVQLAVNHRYAPDRTTPEAYEHVRSLIAAHLGGDDVIEMYDASDPAPPALAHPLLERLVASTGKPPRAKLGWTDVSFFHASGIPATNFGPGDPLLAHSAGERVERHELDAVHAALEALIT